jgi:hypothetical protein
MSPGTQGAVAKIFRYFTLCLLGNVDGATSSLTIVTLFHILQISIVTILASDLPKVSY